MQSVTPTHMVPQAGLPAWTDADASTTPAAHLDPGLEVQVLTRWGDWAYIRCSNNWSAWVDGRRLHPLAAAQIAYQGASASAPTQGHGPRRGLRSSRSTTRDRRRPQVRA